MTKTENYIREFYEIFFAQKKLILWVTLIFFLIAVLIAFFWPPVYSATGSILMKGKKIQKSPESLSQAYEDFYPVTKEDLVSEEHMLVSFEVAKRTVDQLKKKGLFRKKKSKPSIFFPFDLVKRYIGKYVAQRKKAAGKGKISQVENLSQETIDEIYGILGAVKSVVIPSSNIIKISFFDKDPAYAILVLNTLMEQYLLYRQEVINPNQVEMFYAQQVKRFREMLAEKQRALLALTRKTNVTNPEKEIANNLLIRKDLLKQLTELRRNLIEKEKYVQHLENALKNKKLQFFSFITMDQSKTITYISERLLDAVVERENVLKKYKKGSIRVRLVDKKIRDLYSSLRKEVISYTKNQESELQAIKEKIAYMEKRIATLEAMNLALKKQELETRHIQMDIDILKTSYATLQKREEEARMNRVVNTANLSYFVSILNRAFPSNGPVFPKKRVVIPIGLLVGFIIGCSFGFMREYFDHTLKRPRDVETYLGLSVLFSIPKAKVGRAKKIFSFIAITILVAFVASLAVLRFLHHDAAKVRKSISFSAPMENPVKQIVKKPPKFSSGPFSWKEILKSGSNFIAQGHTKKRIAFEHRIVAFGRQ